MTLGARGPGVSTAHRSEVVISSRTVSASATCLLPVGTLQQEWQECREAKHCLRRDGPNQALREGLSVLLRVWRETVEGCQCASRRAPMDFLFLFYFHGPLQESATWLPLRSFESRALPVLPSLIVARFNTIMTTFSPPISIEFASDSNVQTLSICPVVMSIYSYIYKSG